MKGLRRLMPWLSFQASLYFLHLYILSYKDRISFFSETNLNIFQTAVLWNSAITADHHSSSLARQGSSQNSILSATDFKNKTWDLPRLQNSRFPEPLQTMENGIQIPVLCTSSSYPAYRRHCFRKVIHMFFSFSIQLLTSLQFVRTSFK